jgi:MFS transporter, FHS family, glucose/mannose:H+ symporter
VTVAASAHRTPAPCIAPASARPRLVATLYASALLQGVALVSFPAAGNLLRDPSHHALSASRYGSLFLPMFALAALASLGSGRVASRGGLAAVYRAGVLANVSGMALFALSALVLEDKAQAYVLLLFAIGCEGFGFGTTTTALNGHVQRLFPTRSAPALTGLHALLGVGTALPPLLLPLAMNHGGFWLLPLGIAVLFLTAALAFGAGARFEAQASVGATQGRAAEPSLLPVATVAAVYGFAESVVGNWGTLFLHEERGLSLATAGAALGAFWAAVTAGRLLLAAFSAVLPPLRAFAWLPVVLGGGLLFATRASDATLLVVAFACAGLGGSGMLPLTFELTARGAREPERRSGAVFACFLSGSAVGSFGLGLLHDRGLSLSAAFGLAPVLAVALAFATRWALRAARARGSL